ncbi:ER membrane protein complex subunit 1 [Ostrinia nubilalis]|uniref:ER membrane protein complex subunit 1 n=1 Tax=Ostrinia nubilalis TaxID=29057 RepID=UPI0030822D74
MGVLSISIKPNFLGLLKFLNSFNWFIVFFSLINLSVCIYEDQIGKFDWRQTYVGRIKFSQFDTVSTAKKIIVATEENVLAALNLKTGQVVWRHVLESASTGNIHLLHVSEKVVTVTGSNPYLVRGWDSTTGVLLWEWSLTLQKEEHAEFSEWWVQQGMLVHLLPVFGSHLEVSMYNLMTGQNRGATSRLPAIWTNEGCVLSAPYYSCVSGNMGSQLLLSLDVTSNAVQIISKPLSQYISEDDGNIRPLDANSVQPGFIIGDKKIVLIKNNEFQVLGVSVADQSASVAIVDSGSGQLVLQTWTDEVKGFSLTAHSASTGAPVSEIRSSDAAFRPVEPELAATLCSTTPREMHACRLLITAADDSVHLMQQGDASFRLVEPELAATLCSFRPAESESAALCSTTPCEMHACRLLITAADDSVHLMQQGDVSFRPVEPELAATLCSTTPREMHACRLLITAADDSVHLMQQGDASFRLVVPELAATLCSTTPREMHACRLLITAADDSVHLMQQGGRILWSREEALANVVAVEFVDLPVSDLDAAIESEFDQKEAAKMYSSVWAAFSRRLQTQFQQLQTLIQSLKGAETNTQDTSTALVRDYFNLHKIIVLVTDAGKIFGMDNLSGEILWQRFEPSLDAENVVVFTRRSARHPPLDAYLTIVGKHEETGNGLIISLNPIRGTLVGEQVLHLDTQLLQCALLHRTDPEKLHALLLLDKDENVQWYGIVAGNGLIISLNPIRGTLVGERVLHLDTQLLQCALLHRTDPEKLHALLLLDKDENVQVFPASAGPLVENMYLYVADKHTADVQGYALRYDGRAVVAQKTWALKLGGGSPHRIVAARAGGGRAGSAGRVLGDRSVLYKHANPNMVLFVTEGPDPIHKDVVVATCVDAASGAVLASAAARRARALPLAVQQDNFAAFVYHSDKHRRTEIGTLELYEGKSRWLEAGTAFSSFRGARAPSVYRAAYVLPAAPRAFAVTTTERSLTDKHVLLALSTGAILELPWAYLEPRRPLAPTPEQREEGLIPYAPELPLPADAVLNYNRTLHRINAIYTAPSGLESTSLVLATGLDLFYTRVAPNKTFDLLKDDFDYYLITVVLGALILATYSTKYFAARKMLKMAWK